MAICAELGALSQLVAATTPTIARVVAVWRDPANAALHVIPLCGRCREFIRTISQQNLEATVILGPDHTTTCATFCHTRAGTPDRHTGTPNGGAERVLVVPLRVLVWM